MIFSNWLFKPRSTNRSARPATARLRVEALEDRLVPASASDISIGNATVPLGAGAAGFALTRTGDASAAVRVDYTTVNGTATAGINYTATTGSVTFGSGQTTATLAVPLLSTNFMGSGLTFSVVLTGVTVLSAAPAVFADPPTTPTAGNSPFGVTGGDINADGKPDIVVANNGENSVSVLLNTTAAVGNTPSFATQPPLPLPSAPRGVVTTDVNGDGKPDIITANPNSNTVSVLMNMTAGGAPALTFAGQQSFGTGSQPFSVRIGDINGDGKPDIITANNGNNNVSVLLNTTGTGSPTPTFAGQQFFATGSQPFSVRIGDINGDGKPDIITANNGNNNASVLLNTTPKGAATPSFATQQLFATGNNPQSVVLTDVNGDGKPDIVVANYNDDNDNDGDPDNDNDTVSVLLNTTATGASTAAFALQQTFATGNGPQEVTAGDINGDGRPEIVVANENGGNVSVLVNATAPGAAALTFITQDPFDTGGRPTGTAVMDLNGNRPEIVVANQTGNNVSVLRNLDIPPTLGAPGTVTITNSAGQVTLVTTKAGDLLRIDAAGAQLLFGGIVAGASTAFGPAGEVTLVTTKTGDLFRIDASGFRLVLGGIVAGASVAYGPAGEVTLVTTKAGDLFRIDASGFRLLFAGIVAGASVTYDPSGEVTLLTTKSGDLYRIDGAGFRLLFAGIVAGASVAYGPPGEVTLVTTKSGDLFRIDGAGIQLLFGRIVLNGSVAYVPSTR